MVKITVLHKWVGNPEHTQRGVAGLQTASALQALRVKYGMI